MEVIYPILNAMDADKIFMMNLQRKDDNVIAGQNSGPIRVLIADDHSIIRHGLSSLLSYEPDFEVVGEAADGRQAIELAQQCCPEVVIMDINMPVINGIEATRILAEEMPEVKVIALSMHLEKDAARGILEAGAVAYLAKGGGVEELLQTIRACCLNLPRNR